MQVNPSTSGGILSESRFGEDSIIGVLDTGEAVLPSLFAAAVWSWLTLFAMLRLRIFLVCTAQAYGPNQPVLEMMASARFHGGGKGNVSLETDSVLLTATGSPSLDFRIHLSVG
jgi:hypothetical protein